MRKFILLFIITIIPNIVFSQEKKGISDDITVSGLIQIGSGYLALNGLHPTDNFTFHTELAITHKSGIGLYFLSSDDFSQEKFGRIRFFDLGYLKSWDKLSLYTDFGYFFMDNYKDGKCYRTFVKLSYTHGTWRYETMNMLRYFPKNSEDKFNYTLYLKANKTLFKDLDLLAQVWYDNVYKDHVYAIAGAQLNLKKGFFLKGLVQYKDNKLTPMIQTGWSFTTKK